MPRQARQSSESKIYHVMIRGNERKNIFHEDEDKSQFLNWKVIDYLSRMQQTRVIQQDAS